MIRSPTFGKLGKGAAFFFAALCSAAAMRLLARTHPAAFGPWPGLFAVAVGICLSWIALRRWRVTAPIHCATWVGLCAGFAGAGLYVLMVDFFACWLAPVGLIQR